MMLDEKLNFSTKLIHSSVKTNKPCIAVRAPLYDTTTFSFSDTQSFENAALNGDTPFYSRYGNNPNILATEEKLSVLDGTEDALLFSAGMAALSALFITYGKNGILCIGNVYGGTQFLLAHQLNSLGIQTNFIPYDQADYLDLFIAKNPGLIFFESPANPTLDILNIQDITRLAHENGSLVAMDNTFASAINQQPIGLGVDLCMQSATKYLGGHSDLTAGVITGKKSLLDAIRPWRTNLGQICSPATAHLLDRSLATLPLRINCHNENAMTIAKWLEHHPKITKVYYPGLPSFSGFETASRQMKGFGGMISIDIKGNEKDAIQFINCLKLITRAASLGGIESLVSQPARTSHRNLTPEERNQKGISDTLIRLSIGLENVHDIINDLAQALGQV
ncbi:MAG: aminotransferase class I/II-fold pyridoxal phosphate-dependent enzyme [Pseudomonadota bacterium]|nr:aminotransferase class I/II-fold pyridoxal phosphate-dependent enzyme [Pseudomonadota bacterium]